MNFQKNRRFQIENLEERTLLTAAPWSTGDETDYSRLVVTTLEDVVDASDQMTSIREAIAYAETLGGDAEVTFADGLEGTITLARGALTVGADSFVTIDGGGVITIDAGGRSRAFEVGVAGAALNDLGLTGGYHARQGGAVASSGELTMNGVTVSDSYSGKYGSAVYIAPGTSLTVIDSNFTNNVSKTHGGGIFVEKGAQADISGSRFEGNATGSYGAAVYVWNDAAVSVTDTFFVNNIAPNGTIRNYGGELTLTNVVLTGNDQGISSSDGGVNVGINVTMTGNARSAVRGEEGAAFTFYNSVILGGNKTFDLRTGATVGGDVNLSTAEFGSNFVLYDGGDLFAADGYTPVGANQVMNAGSAAYNTTEFDAAGNNRYYGGAIDIGAVEQIVTVTEKPVVFNGLPQAPFEFAGPVDSVLYSLDGETWTEESPIRDAGTYDVWVKTLTAGGDEEIYLVTAEITPLQLTVAGSAVVDKDADGTADAEIIVGDAAPLYDDVTVTAAGQFASAEPGTWDVSVTYTVTGEKAGNYVAPVPETLRGTIVWVEPQSLVVTTLEDVVDRYDGVTSIREAIAYAETFDVPVAVTFADDLEGVIELADGALSLGADNSITVDGGGAITIDAGGRSRALEVGAAGAVLSDLTVTGGYDGKQGGAIAAFGDLFLSNVTVTGSFSGKFGGAVYVAPEASLTVVNSAFAGNTASSHGGAIFVDQGASADVFGSYFSGNATASYGGAFYVWTGATAQIANSFFVNNSAPNGTIRNYGGTLDLINVVVSGNEQGISGSGGGVTTATNVTISRNTRSAVRGDLGAEFIFYNSILTDGYSLFKLSGGASVGGDNNLSTVSFGTNFIKYNGGDLFGADGYSLWGENQAEGAGDPGYNDTALDAAGKNRYYGGTLDLGALEQIITVTGGSMVFNGEYQAPIELDGPADWILYSEDGENWTETPPARNAGTYTFWVKAGTDDGDEEIYEVTGTITPVQLEVTGSTVVPREYDGTTDAEIAVGDVSPLYDDVTITAAGVYDSPEVGEHDVEVTYTVSGENAGNYIAPAPETLRGEITRAPYYSLVVTTLDDVSDPYDDVNSLREAVAYAETFDVPVTVTFADGLSGTILLADGAITVSAAGAIAIDGNGRITVDGGGASRVFNIRAGEVLLANISITGGYDARYGGAVYNAGDLTLENVEITDSCAGKFGGAVYTAAGSNLTVFDSAFDGNTADSHGGAVFVEKEASAEIGRSLFTGNSTAAYGAALYQWSGSTVEVTDTLFLNNNAPNGTIRNHGGILVMTNVVVSGNDQGLAASGSAKVLGINLTVSNNRRSAVRGDSNAEFTFLNSIVIGGKTLFNLSGGATVGGDLNLSTKEFGTNFVKYNGGDLFGADGWTLAGHNQAMNAGNPAYNDTLTDAVGNNRYYGGGLDLGAVEQIAKAIGTSVVYNGEYQAPIDVEGPVTWIKYSEDGETWSDTPTTRDAGTYTIYVMVGTDTPGEERVYEITGTITPRRLTLDDVTVGEKIYDGTTDLDITIGAVEGIVPGEDVTVTAVGELPSAEPGTYEVTVTFGLEGDDAGNYDVPEPITVTVTVEPAVIADVTFDDASFVYNGQARSIAVSGALATDTVLYSTDGVTYTAALPEFTNTGDYTIYAKVSRANYEDWTGSATLTITPAALTVSFTVADREYDGTADAAVSGYTLTGLVAGDDVTVTVNSASFADKSAGAGKAVTVDYTLGGADLGNYAVTAAQTAATITPKHLYAIFRAADKVYDGTADAKAELVEYIGLVDGDDVTVDAVGAKFNDKNAGVKTATVSAYAESGADAANYYIFGSIEGAVISAKQLTISGTTVADKLYDGTTDAEITAGTLSGVIDGETVTVTASGAFPSADAGEYDVPVSYTLGGADAANYAAPAGETIAAKINHLPTIDVTFDDASFVYNGEARSITVSGTEPGDTVLYSTDGVTYSAALPEYTNAGDYTIYAKVSRANYEDWTGSATLTITPAALTAAFTAEDKVYDGTAAASASFAGFTGLIAGDEVTVTVNSASFADKNAGAGKAVSVDYTVGGTQAGNYTVTAVGVSASISAAALTVNFTAADKVYDGTAAASAAFAGFTGLIAGDDVTVTVGSASFADANAGENKAVSVTRTVSGADAANYTITDAAVSATIERKQLTVSGTTAADKVYDGTTDAEITLGEVSGIIAGDAVTVTATGQFAQAVVGTHDVTVTYAISGAGAANYLAPPTETLNATITQRDATDLSFVGGELQYDGTAHSFLLTGVQAGDEVRYSTDGISFDLTEAPSYTDVGTHKVYVKVNRPNHAEWIDDATLVITPATITVSAGVADKVYDGTTNATVQSIAIDGVKDVDAALVNVTVDAAFADKNAGESKAANLTFTLSGAKAGNYVLASSTATATADISKATITVTVAAEDKVYDGTTAVRAALTGVSGIMTGDNVTVSIESAAFADKNAGADKAVNVTYLITGSDAGNYTVEDGGVTADITAAGLTLAFAAADKVYDGTADAGITGYTLTGLVGGETAEVTGYAGAFADKNVGAGKAVTVSGYTITGIDLANYELTVLDTAASITPAALTVNFTAEDKNYDGTSAASAAFASFTGLIAGDDVTVTVNSASFADKNVGTDKEVTVDFTASGADAANYAIAAGTTAADISAIELLVVFAAKDKVYDGTAEAEASILDVVGLIAGDDVTVTANNVTFNDKNAGVKTAAAESYTYGGADAGNYIILCSVEGAVITPKQLTVSGTSVADKNYDGTTRAAVTLGTVSGILAGDDAAVAASGVFPSAVPGDYGVQVTYTISGADAANYLAPVAETITATIFAPETPSMHVTTDSDVVDAFDGLISLREALGVYFKTDGTYTLNADGSVTYGKDASNVTVTFDDDLTEIKAESTFKLTADHDGLVIEGDNRIVFDGQTFTIFKLSGAANLTFNGLTFKNISVSEYCAALYTFGSNPSNGEKVVFNDSVFSGNTGRAVDLSLIAGEFNNSTFTGNTVAGNGGAIRATGALTVTGSTFTGNKTTDGNGGAISASGALTVIDSTFTGNASSGSGGAISAIADVMTVTGSKFTDNTADSFGGAISAHGALTVTDSEFAGNAAKSFGGAISATGALTVTDCDFVENTSETSFGGAIFSSATLTVTGSTFTGNRASTDAGAIFAGSELLTVSGSTFSGNSSQSRGGAIFTSSVSVTDSTFTGNESGVYGGAIYSSTATVTGSTFTENVSRSGGALSGAGGNYTIDDSTFTGNRAGYNGGAISASSATVTGSTFTGNTADNNGGAIAASSATVTDSEFTENTANGGAIFVGLEGTLTVSGSKFTRNTSNVEGGAIFTSEGVATTVSDSTFTGNSANYTGGAIHARGDLTVNTSVLTGNSAQNGDGGAIYVWGGNSALTVYQSLIAENTANGFGGGIFTTVDEGDVNILWSTIAGNTSGSITNWGGDLSVTIGSHTNPNTVNVFGSIVPNIENLGSNIVLTSSLYEDIHNEYGTYDASDPNNYRLQAGDVLFVGGTDPLEAYKLAADSVAINGTGIRTTTGNPTVDLAGNVRPYAGIYDYGAFEWSTDQPETPSMHVTTDQDVVDAYDGMISLREALTVYFQTDGTYTLETDGTITYGKDATNVTVTFENDLSEIKANSSFTLTAAHDGVVINGVNAAGQENHILFKGNNFSVFTVSGNIEAAFNNLIFRDNVTEGDGAAIDAYGNITVSGSEFSGNKTTDGNGGAIRAHGALTVIDSTFTGNASSGSGGAISAIADVMTVTGSKFTDNTAGSSGGAINAHDALTVTDSEFAGNAAKSFGGALSAHGALTVTDCDFIENTSETSFGGAIFNNATLTVTGSTFTGNRASTDAGAIFAMSELLTVSGSTFSGNSSQSRGGAIFTSSVSVTDSTFTGNESGVYGGAIYSSTATVTGSTFTENVSRSGGALSGAGGNYTIDDSTFTGNRAGYNGGAISASSATVTGSTFTGNTADNNGGAIAAASATVTDSEFTENTANGGAIFVGLEGTLTVSGSKFTRNTSNGDGGAILTGENSTATVSDSTFTGNTSNNAGGAIAVQGDLTVNTSVLTGNAAGSDGGAIYVLGGNSVLTVYQSLIAENTANGFGGGIFTTVDEGDVNILWSTVAGNTSGVVSNWGGDLSVSVGSHTNPNTVNVFGSIVPLIENHGSAIVLTSSLYEDIRNEHGTFDVSDPNNYQLQSGDSLFVGGTDPFEAYKLADDSVAINRTGIRTTTDNPTTDLAGNVRPYAGIYDYGAFEWSTDQPETPSMHVTTDLDVVDAYDGVISLREALGVYFQTDGTYTIASDGTITYGKDDSNVTVTFEDSLTEIKANSTFELTAANDGVVINGVNAAGQENHILFKGNEFSVFTVNGGIAASFNNLIFTENSAAQGAAINASATGSNITVTGSEFTGNSAEDGGAIYAEYCLALTVTDSTFTGNEAEFSGGAIHFYCSTDTAESLTITGSTFTENKALDGGVISFYGHSSTDAVDSLTVTESTFTGNTAGSYGGAISAMKAATTVNNCVIAQNSANSGHDGSGGAIYTVDGTLTVTESTLTGNTTRYAGGAIHAQNTAVTVNYSVVAQNTAETASGFYSVRGSLKVYQSLVANNTSKYGGGIQLAGGATGDISWTTAAGNAHNDLDTDRFSAVNVTSSIILKAYSEDQNVVTYASTLYDYAGNVDVSDPNNYQLQSGDSLFVGGTDPLEAYKLADDSVAINRTGIRTTTDNPTTDLAGNRRPYAGIYDYGAFEWSTDQPETPSMHVTTDLDVVDAYDGVISLREALGVYFQTDGTYTIETDGSITYGKDASNVTVTFEDSLTEIKANSSFELTDEHDGVVINGVNAAGQANHILFKGLDFNVFTVAGGIKAAFNNLIFEENAANYAPIYASAEGVDITVSGSEFTGNSSNWQWTRGGAIAIDSGNLTVTDSVFTGNRAYSSGGAISVNNGNLTVTDSVFTGNRGGCGTGGAVYIGSGTLTVAGSRFTGNVSQAEYGITSGRGGAISAWDCDLTVTDSLFADNEAQGIDGDINYGHGGAIHLYSGNLTVTGSEFTGNSVDYSGGAIFVGLDSGPLTVSGSEFTGNSATSNGGAIFGLSSSELTLTGCTFTENLAVEGDGGAVSSQNQGTVTVTDSEFTENTAQNGGAIAASSLTVTGSTFSKNTAQSGGAIITSSATVTGSTFSENSAYNGGAIFSSATTVSGSTFTGNSANYTGGAIYAYGDLTVNTSVLTGNVVNHGDGGAIYVLGGNSALTVYQSLIAENTSIGFGGGIFVSVDEGDVNILWSTIAGNTSGSITNWGGDLSVSSGSPTNLITVNVFGSIVPNIENIGSNIVLTSSLYENIHNEYGTYDASDPNNYQLQAGDVLFVGGTDPLEAYKLAADSVAINGTGIRTTTGNPTVDLAGNVRPYAGIYDYGAFEWSTDQPETPSMHVTTDLDVVDAYDGMISLREALDVYYQTGGTVTFDDDLTEIKANSTFELTAEHDGVSINGVNAAGQENHILFKGNNFSVFTVSGDIKAAFNNLIFRENAERGGAIYVSASGADVTVSGCAFTGNQGRGNGTGVIRNFGKLTVIDSEFTENRISFSGSLIRSSGSLTLVNSNVANNIFDQGCSAISSSGNLTLLNSKVTGNTLALSSYAIHFTGEGGQLTVTQSLIADNSAEENSCGGIYFDADGSLYNQIRWSTIAGNGGSDLYVGGSSGTIGKVVVYGSIVLNTSISPKDDNAVAYHSSLYQSVSGSEDDFEFYANCYQLQSGDKLFVGGSDIATKYKLAAGSVAINGTGITSTGNPTVDLAGNVRPWLGIYDYGAFEWDGPETPSMHVTTDLDVVDAYDGLISLREALGVYFQTDGTVTFDDDLTEIKANSTFVLTAEHDGVSINGVNAAGQANHILFKGNNFSVFTVSGDIKAAFNNLIFRENGERGEAIYVSASGADVTVSGCAFTGNRGRGDGTGVIRNFGKLTVIDSEFTENLISSGGSLIRSSGNLTLVNSNVANNIFDLACNAIRSSGNLTLLNSKVTGNTLLYSSYAIHFTGEGGQLTVTQSLIAGNSAEENSCGGIYFVAEGSFYNQIRWSTIAGNGGSDLYVGGGTGKVVVYGSIVLNTSISPKDDNAVAYHSSLYQSVSGSEDDFEFYANCYQLQSGDKLFVGGNDIATKYRLAAGSVAINATGITSPTGDPTVDLAGVARPQGGVYDYGAYEFSSASPAELPYDSAADAAFASLDADDLLADFDLF